MQGQLVKYDRLQGTSWVFLWQLGGKIKLRWLSFRCAQKYKFSNIRICVTIWSNNEMTIKVEFYIICKNLNQCKPWRRATTIGILSTLVACLFLDHSIPLGFFIKRMTQEIGRDIVQVNIIGAHTMFLYRMIRAIFQEIFHCFTLYDKITIQASFATY